MFKKMVDGLLAAELFFTETVGGQLGLPRTCVGKTIESEI